MTVTHALDLTPPILSALHFLPVDSPLKLLACCRVRCSSAIHNLSTGAIDTILPGSRFGFSSPDQSELVTVSLDGIVRSSTDTWEIVDSFSFVSPVGGGVQVSEAAVTSAYDAIYLLGEDAGGGAIFRYDLSDHSCTFRRPVRFQLHEVGFEQQNSLAVSPDGREIWVLQGRGSQFPIEDSGYILILDGSTGTPLDTIKTMGLLEQYPESRVGLRAIEFHPDEPIAYVATQSELSVLVIDRTSRAIVGSLDVGIVSEILISPSPSTSGHY